MKYTVTFRSKKTKEIIHFETVDSENDIGIILKAKIKAIGNGFRFDKRKHSAGWVEGE